MKAAHINTSKATGKRSLIIYYDQRRDNYHEAINAGLKRFGLENELITVIAEPTTEAKESK